MAACRYTLLLSRDLKRIKSRLIVVCCIMVFARCWDMFWLIRPELQGCGQRYLHLSFGILEYAAVPVALIAFWMANYFSQLKTRPLVATNDPHVAEILELRMMLTRANEHESRITKPVPFGRATKLQTSVFGGSWSS